ncbi:MAG: YfcE family phosphodiesterase [Patescibacteria group bacterium]|nr:YfcE family phosphodiesterase [Patescibacteria group bacterium]
MKIAIISDIHDNLVNLEKCLKWCRENDIKEMICCGDVTNSETLQFLATRFKDTIHLVKGNAETYDESEIKQYDNIRYYGKIGKVKLNRKVIGICHEPYFINKMIKQDEYDIIFYGHTHKPWEEEKNGVRLINSGTLSAMFHKATFAVMEDDKIELKILETLKSTN